MPNLAAALKAEIARLARKELRASTESLKKMVAAQRSEIAALKQRAATLERQLKRAARGAGVANAGAEGELPAVRFSAKGIAAHRQRLGLSADAYGRLLGVTALSVYNWESGKARPRGRLLPAIAAVRKLGKRHATELLEQLGAL